MIADYEPLAKDFMNKNGSRYVTFSESERAKNRNKSKIRARVEHAFGVMKGRFGFAKFRYKGLAKNSHHLFVSCAGEFGHGDKVAYAKT